VDLLSQVKKKLLCISW